MNSIIVSNIDGNNAADVTISLHDGTNDFYHIAKQITVPNKATLIVLEKTLLSILKKIGYSALASAAGDLHCVISYEELDDA